MTKEERRVKIIKETLLKIAAKRENMSDAEERFLRKYSKYYI
jgi:hypothetical protein